MKRYLLTLAIVCSVLSIFSQSGTEFWFAPPDVTFSHNSPGGVPIYLNMSTFSQPATVTIDQPANPGFTPIIVVIPANSSLQQDLSAFVADLETAPTDAVLTTGLRIISTDTITAYYEVSNTNNTDIFALKGKNSLGKEFYVPLHNHAAFWNHNTFTAPNLAYASFDIVATENNTTVMIYTPLDVDGHVALTPFTIILNQGETYSCGWTGANYELPSTHPGGSVIISDKDIAVTIKDDSNHNPAGGCYDLLGDQIVPVGIVGTEYIAVKGQLNITGDESVFILATENNTQVYIDGNAIPLVTLFAGQTYRYDMDYLATSADNSVYIVTSKPAYVTHVTGFGCEAGQAILPPLGCAGSEQISFSRSTSESFFLNILVRATSVNDFTMTGPGTGTINAGSFLAVPGTGGIWMAAQIPYTTAEVPVNQAHLVTNSTDVFSLAIINGGAATGCRYGFFSEFAAEIIIDAGLDATVCANDTSQLTGSVNGGTTTGQWTTSGSGQFLPNDLDLNAQYAPSPADISAGVVTITLTSTGNCTPVSDNMTLNITPAPTVDAGIDVSACENNPDVSLIGVVTTASGGIWSGGAGIYTPNNTSLITTYTPTATEITAGTVTLTLTTTGNGTCNPETDNITITFTPPPTVDAGSAQSVCGNNPDAILGGSILIATGGIWSGGTGTFSPNVNALNATYTPTAPEIASGSITLTLTTTGNANCNAESDVVTITYTTSPTANAGIDQTVCGNNPDATLNGSVTVATGGVWSGGLGTFTPDANTLNATYTPTAAEISSGSVTLTLTTTGNANCTPVTDDITINFTASPTVNADVDQTVCANNSNLTLNGSVTVATGGVWSGGTGTFTPNSNTLNATYAPSAAEITAGTVTLTLTTTGNGTCNAENDNMVVTINPAPIVSAGADLSACGNNPDVTLSGSVSFAGGGIWSGGTGTFNPSNTTLNATYTPSAAEITAGSVNLTLTSTGNGLCNAENDIITITITSSPIVDAGIDQTICANNSNISLSGTVSGATGGLWTGGLGTFSPNNTTLNVTYTPTALEIASGTLILTLTSTGNGNCIAESDNMVITFTSSPTVNAGSDVSVCANTPDATLSGVVTIATGGVWIGGSGTYNPSTTDLNVTYTPSASEISSGTVTLTLQTSGNGNCIAETDNIIITIEPEPITSAGANLTSCANNPNVNLAGTVTNATGGLWTGGTGSYNASSIDLNAIYTPSLAEITAGTVTLILTATGTGSCAATNDQVDIFIANSPTADAGVDQTICANNSDITLTGSVTGASGGQWTGGLGIFTPSNNALNTVYTPTLGEVISGSLTLTLTSTGNGSCNSVTNDMTVTFTQPPTADAGIDVTVCANNSTASLNGTISIATGGIWTGGGGTFAPSNTDLNATYTPTAAEITTGSVTLTLTTTGNGSCNAESDDVLITINPEPTVNAGTDQTICVSNLNINLSGSVFGITNTGQWSSSGSGIFVPNNTTLNATYVASTADSIAGSVTLTLQSTNNGTCLPIMDDLVITILPGGISDAGLDAIVCANNSSVNLSGNVSGGATTGIWTTSGTGVFVPNDSSLTATYAPSSIDAIIGTVTLTLTANSCDLDTDDMIITITPEPIVSAGTDQTVCATSLNIPLTGSVSGASTTGLWTTLGSGTFTPSATDLNATYVASSADSLAQNVVIVLEATNIGSCLPVVDTMIINIFPTGSANAGGGQNLCANNGNVSLNGYLSGGATQGQWSSSGFGTFSPNDTALNATYIPNPVDTILGTISLTLTATNSCNAASDFLVVNYSPAPSVDAGPSLSMCGTNPSIGLSGTINGALGGQWSTNGTGTFSPNTITLTPTYNATPADIASGSITIYLTSTGNGSCNAVVDSMIINITTGISVDAGSDQTVCSTAGFTFMQGVVGNGSTTGIWTTLGSGVFQPNDSLLTAEYQFSTGDTTIGSVAIILTSTNNGSCVAETDTMTITFGNTAYVNAGSDQIVCAGSPDVNLNGLISGGASQGQWQTLGSGSFAPADTVLNATYSPSATDLVNGFVDLVLLTTDHGSCIQGTDTVMISIEGVPSANAGTNIQICSNADSIPLSGSVTNASGGIWTTTGTGTFFPNDTTLSVVYVPSASDIGAGSITLLLTSSGTTLCIPAMDSITINVVTPLNVDFGFIETCMGQPMNFFDSTTINSGSISSWTWDFGDGDSSLAQNPIHIYTSTGTFDVILTVESSLGCGFQLIQTITVNGSPTAGFGVNPDPAMIDEVISFNDISSGATDWNWDFGDGFGVSSDQNPNYSYTLGGNYTIIQTVTNVFGCYDTSMVTITISDELLYPPSVPSGFSPNGDGENDALFVLGGPFLEIELRVYNNWGNLIFESIDETIGWDGKWKGKDQPTGDYIYTVKAITIDGQEYKDHGSVSIIR